MKHRSGFCWVLVLFSCSCFWGCQRAPPRLRAVGGPLVRILVFPDQEGQVTFQCDGEVQFHTLPDLVPRNKVEYSRPVPVVAEDEGFRFGGEYMPSPMRITPTTEHLLKVKVSGGTPGSSSTFRAFRGVLDLLNIEGKIRIINEVAMEEYLAGVVGAEMPEYFSTEALASQAIASRTYALFHLRPETTRPLREAMASSSDFQVYRGYNLENDRSRQAVESTAGWVLTHQGKIFSAYYHSTCGGHTTNNAWVFGDRDIPPLRGVPCGGCANSPDFHWTFVLPMEEIEAIVRPWAESRGITMGQLKALEGVDELPGGYLRYVRVVHQGGSFEIRADRFRGLLIQNGHSSLRSTSFVVAPGSAPGTAQFTGSGWGHGVGLCQYGAANKGRTLTHGQILAHYYPMSELKKVY